MNHGSAMDATVQALVAALARYLCEHPAASDSAQGMRHWWLERSTEATEMQLQAALEWMMAQALIERVGAADGRVRYSRRADVAQLAAVQQLLDTVAARQPKH